MTAEVRLDALANDAEDASNHQRLQSLPTALTAPGLQSWEVINLCGLSLTACGSIAAPVH